MNRKLSYANVMSTVAVFVALGGSSYAAVKITGKDIADNSITGKDIRRNAIKTSDVADGALLAQDFKAGQLPRGERGPAGPRGATGTVDTSNFYDKAASDARFRHGGGHVVDTGGTIVEGPDTGQTIGGLGTFSLGVVCRDSAPDYLGVSDKDGQQLVIYTDDGSGSPSRDIFIAGAAGVFATVPDRIVMQAIRRFDPSVALTATVTVADTGPECEYAVHASSTN